MKHIFDFQMKGHKDVRNITVMYPIAIASCEIIPEKNPAFTGFKLITSKNVASAVLSQLTC